MFKHGTDDPKFPGITYRRGASGSIAPVLRDSGLRVQTLVIDSKQAMPIDHIAAEYDLEPARVREALAFYAAHPAEIDADIQAELALEPKLG